MSDDAKKPGGIGIPGILKGLAITARTMAKPTHTAEYPDAQPHLPPRSRGVIALLEENCTSCMLCARECPDWCIYIDSHKETIPATTEGGRERQRNVLDRFAIDFSLCMYCGICIEVCPFDALHWSPEFEYAELDIRDLLHEKDRLGQWMPTVPPPSALDEHSAEPAEIGATTRPGRLVAHQRDAPRANPRATPARRPPRRPPPGRSRRADRAEPRASAGARRMTALDVAFAAVGLVTAASGLLAVTTRHVVHAALWLVVCLGAVAGCYLVLGAEFVALVQLLVYVGAIVVLVLFALMLTRAPIGPNREISTAGCTASSRPSSARASPRCWPRPSCRSPGAAVERRDTSTTQVAEQLFGTWVWPFEVLSLLLLVALIAAMAVSRMTRPEHAVRRGRTGARRRPCERGSRHDPPRRALPARRRPRGPRAPTACWPGATRCSC